MTPYRKWMAVFDNHGDMQDDGAVKAAMEFKKFWKPQIRIHGGDCFDYRCLRKKATEQEKRERIDPDHDAGIEFIKKYEPTHFLRGNHDERAWDAAKSDEGKTAKFGGDLVEEIVDALGDIPILPYDKRNGLLRIGHLKIVHGYNTGVTAARVAGQVYGSVLMGHLHTIDQYSMPGMDRRIARVCGCLCKLDQEYNRAQIQTLRQAHGWAYGILYSTGEYVCWQAEMVAGRWVFPSELRELGGKHEGGDSAGDERVDGSGNRSERPKARRKR